MTVQIVLQTTESEAIQIVKIETIRLLDHKNSTTIDHNKIIVLVDPVIFLGLEATTIGTDQEISLNHQNKIILNFQTHKVKTVEAVHQNTKHKLIKNNLQRRQIRTFQVSTIQKLRNYS